MRASRLRFPAFSTASVRLVLLWACIAAIGGASYLALQKVSHDTGEAMRWVAHTHEVREVVFELRSSFSEMETAALVSRVHGDAGAIPARYAHAHEQIQNQLDALRELTRDSADQQERIGMLRERIHDRVSVFDRVIHDSADVAQAAVDLENAVTRFSVDDITQEILAHEDALMQTRQATADRLTHEGNWATLLAMLAQMLLLGAVIWASERQARRRAVAESITSRAIGAARLIVETVREPIAVISHQLTILQANRAFADFYGNTDSAQRALNELPGWRGDTALQQKLRDVSLTQRELWDYETVQKAADVTRNVLVNARPMILPDTSDTVALLTVSDLTSHKRSQAQILELNRQLEGKVGQITEVNRELEAFSYSVSHDLRAPLRHISGFAEKLLGALGDNPDEKMVHYCDVIAVSARRMSMLIEDLLIYSRLGKHALRQQPVDMQSLVEEVRAVLMSSVEGRNISWGVAPLPVVIADATMLRLAWQNLLDNAIKYSARRDEAIIEIGSDERGEERIFWVRDNGAGFDMRYIDKLFGVFQRLHKASDFSGTGVGLASVRRIIARHGGRTWAEGAPDQGATFFFSLPLNGGS